MNQAEKKALSDTGAKGQSRSGAGRLQFDRGRLILLGAFLLVLIVSVACVALSVLQPRSAVSVGDVLEKDILAPRDMYDEDATVAKRLQASSSVERVYKTDEEILMSLTNGAADFFDALDRVRADAETLRKQKVLASPEGSDLRSFAEGTLTAEQWEQLILPAELAALRPAVLDALSDDELYGVFSVSNSDMSAWMREASLRISSLLRRGIKDSDQQEIRTEFRQNLEPLTPLAIRSLCAVLAREFLNPTMLYSETDTLIAMENAASMVEDQVIKKGEVLAAAGTVVTEELYEHLSSANVLQSPGRRWAIFLLTCLAVAVLFIGLLCLMRVYLPRFFLNCGKCMQAAVLLAVSILLAALFLRIDIHYNPIYLSVLLLALLVSGKIAAIGIVFLAAVFGMMAVGTGLDYSRFAQVFLMTLVGGFAAVLHIRRATRRSALFVGGALCAAAMMTVVCMFGVWDGQSTAAMALDCLRVFGGALVCAIVGIGIMPFWEWLFDVATPQRLAELSNANHPLLQRMMFEAPGTYHHSMLVSTMSEAACNAIGADGLLARVGAFYHDIGKLKRPYYFKENQKPGDNPHDSLEPERSAAVLLAHVRDGVAMGHKAKLPADVIRIIQEHHGTTMASFFYYKAVKLRENPNLSQNGFRYPGPKPTTKESAVVMICDSCEAAVRSIESHQQEQIREMVGKIIRGKMDEGQFASCDLTLAELSKIEAAILSTLKGIYHERIEYPDLEDLTGGIAKQSSNTPAERQEAPKDPDEPTGKP